VLVPLVILGCFRIEWIKVSYSVSLDGFVR